MDALTVTDYYLVFCAVDADVVAIHLSPDDTFAMQPSCRTTKEVPKNWQILCPCRRETSSRRHEDETAYFWKNRQSTNCTKT